MKRYELRLLVWVLLLFSAALLLAPLRSGVRTEGIILRESSLRLAIGQQRKVQYALESGENGALVFSSDAPLVVNVDQEGLVTAVSPGRAVITLRVGDLYAAALPVTVSGVAISELNLDASELTLQKGQRSRLTARTNADATDARLNWFSDDERVVTVDQRGQLTAIGPGDARVTVASMNGISAEALVRVEVPAESVRLEPEALTMGVGGSVPLTAIFTPADATDRPVFWSSADPAVAAVDDSGRVTALTEGSTRIRAVTASGLRAELEIAVEAPAQSVEIAPGEAQVARGAEVLLEAVIRPDSSIGHHVAWSSDAPEVASVSNGVVQGRTAGTANIVAEVDGLRSAPCAVTVRVLPETITLEPREYAVSVAGTNKPLRLEVRVLPEDAEDARVTFSSDNEAVALVDEDGIVTFTGEAGAARIVAQTGSGLSDACAITVTED